MNNIKSIQTVAEITHDSLLTFELYGNTDFIELKKHYEYIIDETNEKYPDMEYIARVMHKINELLKEKRLIIT